MAMYVIRLSTIDSYDEDKVIIEADSLTEALSEYNKDWYHGILDEDYLIDKLTVERYTSISRKEQHAVG